MNQSPREARAQLMESLPKNASKSMLLDVLAGYEGIWKMQEEFQKALVDELVLALTEKKKVQGILRKLTNGGMVLSRKQVLIVLGLGRQLIPGSEEWYDQRALRVLLEDFAATGEQP